MTRFLRAYRVPFAIALLVVVVVGPVVSPDSAQPASRITLSAALVEHHSVDITPYKGALVLDFANYRGRLRSDKAPGEQFLAVPAYFVAKLVGAESAEKLRVDKNLGLWWVTFWMATLPLAALLALLYVVCCRFTRGPVALAVTLLLGFGTMLLPYAANLFGHDLAAILGFGAWLVLQRSPLDPRRAAIAGLLAGTAIFVEYETTIIAAVLVGYLLVRDRRRIVQFAAGAIPPIVALGCYQWRAFGAPWRTPAAFYAGTINGTTRGGYSIPTLSEVWSIFGGARGLWVGAPIAIVGIGAAGWLVFQGRGAVRDHSLVALAIIVPYIVLCAGWSGTPLLEDPGPRYLIPALPFLAVPLAALWDKVRVVGVPASIVGVLVAGSATFTQLLVSRKTKLLSADRYMLQHHMFAPTLWTMGLGRFGVVVYGLSVVAAVALLARAAQHRTDVRQLDPEPLV